MSNSVPTALRSRVRGQEVELRVIKDSVLYDTITKITSFTAEPMLEIQSQGFLGGMTEEKDEIFNGCKFGFEAQLDGPEWFDMQQAIIKRSQRITPDVKFTIVATLYFSNGQTRIMVIPDAKFGAIPMNVGSRKDYVTVKIDGEASAQEIQEG